MQQSDCFWLGSSSRPKRAAWVPATAVEMYIPCQTLSKRLGAYTSPTSRNHDPNLGAGGCREAGGEVACAPYESRGGKAWRNGTDVILHGGEPCSSILS